MSRLYYVSEGQRIKFIFGINARPVYKCGESYWFVSDAPSFRDIRMRAHPAAAAPIPLRMITTILRVSPQKYRTRTQRLCRRARLRFSPYRCAAAAASSASAVPFPAHAKSPPRYATPCRFECRVQRMQHLRPEAHRILSRVRSIRGSLVSPGASTRQRAIMSRTVKRTR